MASQRQDRAMTRPENKELSTSEPRMGTIITATRAVGAKTILLTKSLPYSIFKNRYDNYVR